MRGRNQPASLFSMARACLHRAHMMPAGVNLKTTALLGILLVCVSFAGACASEHARLMREKYPAYPEVIKRAIDHGYPMRGMDHEQLRLALGEPICTKTITVEGRPVEVWLFPPAGRDPCVTPDFRVYFEQGFVTGWQDLRRATPGSVPPIVKRGNTPGVSVE